MVDSTMFQDSRFMRHDFRFDQEHFFRFRHLLIHVTVSTHIVPQQIVQNISILTACILLISSTDTNNYILVKHAFIKITMIAYVK